MAQVLERALRTAILGLQSSNADEQRMIEMGEHVDDVAVVKNRCERQPAAPPALLQVCPVCACVYAHASVSVYLHACPYLYRACGSEQLCVWGGGVWRGRAHLDVDQSTCLGLLRTDTCLTGKKLRLCQQLQGGRNAGICALTHGQGLLLWVHMQHSGLHSPAEHPSWGHAGCALRDL